MAKKPTSSVTQRSGRWVLALAIVFGLIAAILIFAILSNNDSSDKTEGPGPSATTVKVVTAATDIAERTSLSADELKVVAVPAELALSGSYSDTASLVGLTTRYPLVKGEQVTASKISEEQKGDNDKSLSRVVPAGKRAVAIPAEQQSIVGGLILPGDFVDIIAIFSASDVGVDKSVTIVQNVEVLAVGEEAQEPIPPPASAGATATPGTVRLGQAPADAEPQPDARTVTVAVTPEQAQLVALTAEKAKLWLALRPLAEEPNAELGETDLGAFGIGQ